MSMSLVCTVVSCPIARLLAIAGAAVAITGTAAVAAPIVTATYENVPSYKLIGNGGNATRVVGTGASLSSARTIHISGTLRRQTNGTYPREAAIRFQRMESVAQNISQLTHEFIAQPLTGTTFDATGRATVDLGSFVLPVPLNLNFNGGFAGSFWGSPGYWSMQFFEQYDDNAADASSTPDSIWETISFTFDDASPSLATAAPQTGTVAASTFYGARSDDTLDAGAFTGSILSNLAVPTADRIRHVRVSGYLTNLVAYSTSPGASNPQINQARLRLVRSESVLLSPSDPQAQTTNDELLISVPSVIPSSGYVSIDVPISANNDFGKLTRNVPNPEGSSYYGITYYANCYEAIDDAAAADSVWNGIKIEFFSDSQPASTAADFGLLEASPPGTENVRTLTAIAPAGQPKWFRFELPVGVDAGSAKFLDVDTEDTAPAFDTAIALYAGSGLNAGNRLASDDDDGSGTFSQLSFGSTTVRPAIGISRVRDGRDGDLPAGVYYVAVIPYVAPVGLTAFGANGFAVTSPDAAEHTARVNVRFNAPLAPAACSLADIAGGGADGNEPDGIVDGTDFVKFINSFGSGDVTVDPLADVNGDSIIDGNDFVAFINAFAAGC